MIDFHCHLDLYHNPMEVFDEVNKRHTEVLAVTTSPRAFIRTSQHFFESSHVRVALGFHPELISQRPAEKELFFEQLKSARFVGEIGIDGSQRMKESFHEQKAFFNDAIHAASIYGGKILSIHSRGAAKDVLQILEKNEGSYVPILHWFTGSIKEAEKAIELGCWFSINPNMCYTSSGRKIISCIPIERMLPETDAPFTQKTDKPYMPWDMTVDSYLANEHNMSIDVMNSLLLDNLQKLEKT